MKITTTIRNIFTLITGYWIYKKSALPPGVDLKIDIQNKLKINPNIIFDVGANVGQSIKGFKKLFPESTIYSFEPIKDTYQKLLSTAVLYTKVITENFALGSFEGNIDVSIYDEKDSVLNSLIQTSMNHNKDATKESIKQTSLDKYCERNKIEIIDLLKIDTEGYELEVLKGALKTIKNNKIKLILCEVGFSRRYKRHTCISELNDFLSEKGFCFFHIYDSNPYLLKKEMHYANALYISSHFAPEKVII
ncbi:MAG: FkbM family methyltransferase [Bacteroidia bacterium]|jgi:FkbM family methyltransferase